MGGPERGPDEDERENQGVEKHPEGWWWGEKETGGRRPWRIGLV